MFRAAVTAYDVDYKPTALEETSLFGEMLFKFTWEWVVCV